MEIKEQMENRVKAEQLLELCKSCPHDREDCLALNNQCPDERK